ncbi:hypothetical protein H4S06_003419 [Coemansia sp. BCRC 34490]|nr:hypothetical protein H4S06_003419 [Coemansia sp. BCRC 34490]
MCDFIFIPIFCGTWNHVRSLGLELMPCPRCHNTTIRSIRRRTWATLYCVPIFPISRRRMLYRCDICRWEGVPIARVRVNNDEYQQQQQQQQQLTRQPGERRSARRRAHRESRSDREGSSASSAIRAAAAVDALEANNGASSSARGATAAQFQPEPYSQRDYENPPPPYTASPPANASSNAPNNRHKSE